MQFLQSFFVTCEIDANCGFYGQNKPRFALDLALTCSVTFTRVINLPQQHNLLLSTCSLLEARCKRISRSVHKAIAGCVRCKTFLVISRSVDVSLIAMMKAAGSFLTNQNSSVDNAVNLALHFILKHLET